MQIFGGSEANHDGGFLHAGYLSAYPRTYEPNMTLDSPLDQGVLKVEDASHTSMYRGRVIDVGESLELVETDQEYAGSLEVEMTTEEATSYHPAHGASSYYKFYGDAPDLLNPLPIAITAFALISPLIMISCRKRMSKKIFAPLALAMLISWPLFLVLLFGVTKQIALSQGRHNGAGVQMSTAPPPICRVEALPDPERLCAYEDPYAATRAIIHAVMIPAVTGMPAGEIQSMSDIREEIGLPMSPDRLTPGMRYALTNYDRDGWGTELRLELTSGSYEVKSAGPDKQFSTGDDIRVVVPRLDVADGYNDEYNWEPSLCGVYLDTDSEEMFLHRVAHPLFQKETPDDAKASTGNGLYDVMSGHSVTEKIEALPISGELLFVSLL